MFNVSVNDKKNIYRSKPVMNVDTVPKPLTYDYMPEGYPSKSMGTVALMEEQEVTFADYGGGTMIANSPVDLDIKLGDELTVIWDGVSYDAIVTTVHGSLTFGNLRLMLPEVSVTTNYPFLYVGPELTGNPMFAATDTATSHTIKVTTIGTVYQTMDANYIPEGYPNEARVTEMINTALGVIENGSY